MLRWSLVFLVIAIVLGLVGLSGIGQVTWSSVSTAYYVFLLFPALILLTVALSKSFKPHTMIAFRAVMFIVMGYTLLAFLL